MDSTFPIDEEILVLKGEERLGPFNIDEILLRIENGELAYDDVCLRQGADETERLRDILDWDEVTPKSTAFEKGADPENNSEDRSDPVEPTGPARRPLYHGHRSIVTFPLTLAGLVGGVIGGIWLYPTDFLFTIAGITVSAFSLAYLSLVRYTREYFITEKRVELVTGLIARSSKEVRIADIRAVNISCDGVAGMIGVGTVDFYTIGDNPEVTFTDAWKANQIKSLVRKLQDSAA